MKGCPFILNDVQPVSPIAEGANRADSKDPRRWALFGVCASMFLISMLYRSSAAVIAADLSADLKLGPEDLGLLGAVFFYVFGLAQIPLGPFLDRIGPKRTMIFLNLVGVAGAIVFSRSQGLAGGLCGRALMGLGMSSNLMGPLKLYTRWFPPQEFATISGLMVGLGSIGAMMASTPLVLLAGAAGWRGAFVVLAVIHLAAILVLALIVKDAPAGWSAGPTPGESLPPLKSVLRLLKDRSFWSIGLTAGLRYGTFASIQTLWAGPFLMIHLGLSELTTGNLLLVLGLGVVLGAPLGGVISDRVIRSRKKTVFISLIGLAAGAFILAHWPGPVMLPLLGVVLFLYGLASPFAQVLYAHAKELIPEEMSGTAMTGVNFFVIMVAGLFLHGLGGVLGRGSGGELAAGGDYYTAFMVCFGGMVLACVIYAFSRDVLVTTAGKADGTGAALR